MALEFANWQFNTKTVETNADLSEHLADFESIWAWSLSQWRATLSKSESIKFEGLTTDTERDAFRIIRDLHRSASHSGGAEFPISRDSLAARLRGDRAMGWQATLSPLRVRNHSTGESVHSKPAVCGPSLDRCRRTKTAAPIHAASAQRKGTGTSERSYQFNSEKRTMSKETIRRFGNRRIVYRQGTGGTQTAHRDLEELRRRERGRSEGVGCGER